MKTLAVVLALVMVLAAASAAMAGNEDFEKGVSYYGKKDYRHAETYLKKYASEFPDPVAYYLLGYADYKLKKFSEANKYFSEAYLIDPNVSPKASRIVKSRRK